MHVVLFEPDIPGNTGNVARSCVATGSTLHLVGRLGFSLEDSRIKRAGLDYWPKLKLVRHADWEAFLQAMDPVGALYFFSKKARPVYWDARFVGESYLVFGCETKGLPAPFFERYPDQFFRIPMQEDSVRSLNLSTSVGIVLFEALRQNAGVRAQ